VTKLELCFCNYVLYQLEPWMFITILRDPCCKLSQFLLGKSASLYLPLHCKIVAQYQKKNSNNFIRGSLQGLSEIWII